MDNIHILISVALIWSIAVITPGPNFFIVVHNSLKTNDKSTFYIVMGIVAGTFIWSFLGFLGISYILINSVFIFSVLKLLGGLYLIYLGLKLILLKEKKHIKVQTTKSDSINSFKLGLFTNLSNPKTAIFMTSLFATTLQENTSFNISLLSLISIVLISFFWYYFIAYIFSKQNPQAIFEKYQTWINKLSGGLFVIFGVNVISNR